MEEKIEKESSNKKSGNKKFFIIYILALIIITSISIFITIRYIDKNNTTSPIAENTYVDSKIKAEDAKYALTSYSETYNENDLVIKGYIDYNGEVVEGRRSYSRDDNYVSFVQIDGLKDKNIQDIVNKKLKDSAYALSHDGVSVDYRVMSSFSNVLSVGINNESRDGIDDRVFLNIDLTTGEEIPLEKIFVSSASINSILSEGLHKTLAWDYKSQHTNEENWDDLFDLSNCDISDFESKSMILAKRYEKNKGNIHYLLGFRGIYIYDLLDGLTTRPYNNVINIDFVDHMEDVAIFKRYVTSESIFEKNDIGMKNLIVCEYPATYIDDGSSEYQAISLNYGLISDNIFIEDYLESYGSIDIHIKGNILEYLKDYSNKNKNSINAATNEGIVYQRVLHASSDELNEHYYIRSNVTITSCEINYFKENIFRDYIKVKNRERADVGISLFEEDDYYHEFPKLKTKLVSSEEVLVFDRNGNYVGVQKENDIINTNINNDTTMEEENVESPQEIKNEVVENNTISTQDNSISNNTTKLNEITNEVSINNTISENTTIENN